MSGPTVGRGTAAQLLSGQRVLVCDGAMGTMLHAAGAALDRSLPELNLSDPGLVATIHDSYLSAGADIIQANTFGANGLWLADHGFPDKVAEINRAGVRLARAAADRSGRQVLVAGSVSPAVTALQRRRVGADERMEVIREQILALVADGAADLLILETFGYLDELVEAISVAASVTDLPLIAQATFADDAHTLGGETPREVATVLSGLPVTMIGTNCTIGPQRMLTVAEDLVRYSARPVSAQPNAGQPRRTGPRFVPDGTAPAEPADTGFPGCPVGAGAPSDSSTDSLSATRWRQGPARSRFLKKNEHVHFALRNAPSASTTASLDVSSALNT